MADTKLLVQDSEDKMKKTLDVVFQSFSSIRSGRANAGMVEHIRIDYYGTPTPLKQVASITVPEPKVLMIQPWDASAIKAIEKGLMESDLGISPMIDGNRIRLVVPTLTKERREDLIKISKKSAEEGRVSVRSIRRDVNEKIKTALKDKTITEDEHFKFQETIQKLTDQYIQKIDQALDQKEKELGQG